MTDNADGVNWIKIGDTQKGDLYINSTKEKITSEGAKKSRKVSKGEIIVSNSMSYGQPYILNIDGYIHDGWFVIRNYEKNLNKEFLLQLLGSELIQKQYKRLAAGGVVSNISSDLVYSVRALLPPLPEQQKIAKILSTWDKAIATTERLIATSQQQKKALMQQLLTGKKRLVNPETGMVFERDWEEVKLGRVCTKITDGAHNSPASVESGFPMFSVKDMSKSGFLKNSARLISSADYELLVKQNCRPIINDILIAKDGSILKHCFVLKEDVEGVILSSIAILRPNMKKISPLYVSQYLSQDFIKTFVAKVFTTGSGVPRIVLKDFKSIKLHIGSLTEQNAIAHVLTMADKEIELLEAKLAHQKDEKKALMQQLLTGKRRVKVDFSEVA